MTDTKTNPNAGAHNENRNHVFRLHSLKLAIALEYVFIHMLRVAIMFKLLNPWFQLWKA
jgi:hypothetical protein